MDRTNASPCRSTSLSLPSDNEDSGEQCTDKSSKSIDSALTRRLYVSHFLSTWNSRLFEFGSVLFLASIYPHTLGPISVYAMWRAVIAILFAPAVSWWVDHGDRLVVVGGSIVGERLATAASCFLLLALTRQRGVGVSWLASGLFSAVIILAGVEKLCSVMNSAAVTKDWVRPLV